MITSITPQQLVTVFPAMRNPGTWVRTFDQMLDEFELRPPQRLTMFLAQTGFESESFNQLRELLSYRTAKLIQSVWPHEFKTEADAQPYVLNPQGLANRVYANRNGNGPESSGDGFIYRGGGLIELTGRGNYKGVGEALNLDLEQRPRQIEQPLIAARTAGFFWKQNDLNAAADVGDFDYTTRKINGAAMHAADERRALWEKLKVALGTPSTQRKGNLPGAYPLGHPYNPVRPPTSNGPTPGPVPLGTADGVMSPDSQRALRRT